MTELTDKPFTDPHPLCTGVYKNKLVNDFSKNVPIRDPQTGVLKKREGLYFSCFCDSVEKMKNGDFTHWPLSDNMPVIFSDKRTVDDIISKGCPQPVFRGGKLIEVHMLPLDYEEKLKSTILCANCKTKGVDTVCARCNSVYFCTECKRYATTNYSPGHSKEECLEMRGTQLIKDLGKPTSVSSSMKD